MKLLIDNLELEFKQFIDHTTNKQIDEWGTVIQINNSKYEIKFREEIFKDYRSGEVKINWEFVKQVVKVFKENIESLIIKSINVLIPLHQQIFENEYFEKDGYFDLLGVEIIEYRSFNFNPDIFDYQFDLIFFLESRRSLVDMDSNFMYYSTFTSPMLTMVGVQRK